MRQDQERIKNLLIDTVTLLCKNSVQFQNELHVEGLLGVSVDQKDVFFIHISKEFANSPASGDTVTQCVADSQEDSHHAVETTSESDSVHGYQPDGRPNTSDNKEIHQRLNIKTEPSPPVENEDECLIVEDPRVKLEGRASSAQIVAGQRRAVKRTSTADSQHYSSDSNISGGYGVGSGDGDSFDSAQYGEPTSKRRNDNQTDDSYPPGDGEDAGGTPWPSVAGPMGFDPSHSFQQDSDNSQIDGSQPGCSTWSASRGISESAKGDGRVFGDRLDPLAEYSNADFMARYGLSKDCVRMLAGRLAASELGRAATHRAHSTSDLLTVCMGLQFLSTGCVYGDISEPHGVSRAAVCRAITKVVHLLVQLSREFIKFPTSPQHRNEIAFSFEEIAGFPHVVGVIDGAHIPIRTPIEDEGLYANQLGYHSINVQVICDARHRILDVDARWPGSTDDAAVWKHSIVGKACEQNGLLGNHFLLGDNGYALRPWLMTPYMSPQRHDQVKFNQAHRSTLNTIQTMIGRWKKTFQCLSGTGAAVLQSDPGMSSRVIVASAVLHNLTIDTEVPYDPGHPPSESGETAREVDMKGVKDDSFQGTEARANLTKHYFS